MKILIVLFSFILGSVNSQCNIKPFIKTAGAWSLYDRDLFTIDASLAGGVHFNEHFSLQMGVNSISTGLQLKVLTLSSSVTYRIFKSKYPVSPVIGIDLGTQIWSVANGELINSGDVFSSYYASYNPSSSNYRYKRGLFFGKLKLLADFKISQNNLNLMFGPTFNLMYFKIDKVQKFYNDYLVVGGYVSDNYGFGLELSLMYTFPMKKRAAKAQSGGE